MGRRSRLAKPRGRSRKTHSAASRAQTRGSPSRRPATRVPLAVMTGGELGDGGLAVGGVVADFLDVRETPGGREAGCPQRGQVVQPFADAEVARVVDRGFRPERFSFLVVLLDLGVLVVDVQRRDHALGQDPGAESARRGPRSLADDPPGEDEPGLVRAADVQVVADDLLEEDPPGDRLVQHLGQGELRLQHRDLIPVPGRRVLRGERARQQRRPLGGQVPDDLSHRRNRRSPGPRRRHRRRRTRCPAR